jgi:RimJ/RimL family protein N-acetyltransferase
MKAVLNIAFAECKFESVFARVERENVRSKNILLRHGFREIGTVEYARISPNKKVWVDDVWYQLLNVAYKNELKNNS